MTSGSFRRYRPGSRIGKDLSILSVIAEVRGRHPIYLAWDARSWCPVACKIHRNTAKAEKEHAVLAKMSHPNIVRPLGTYEPAILLLEFLEGPTLKDYVDRFAQRRMGISDAMRIGIHVGGALEHIHSRGYCHLDVKPGNLIIMAGRPMLFDFGTARENGSERPPVVQGTDAYMSPEECALGPVYPASDVFGLGVVLFELLAGELPFDERRRKGPYPQQFQSPKMIRDFRPGVPKSLQSLIHSCLDPVHTARPTICELLPALHGHIQNGPRMWPIGLDPAKGRANSLAA